MLRDRNLYLEALHHFANDHVTGMAVRAAGVERSLSPAAARDEELRADLILAIVDEGDGGAPPMFDARRLLCLHVSSLGETGGRGWK